MKKGIKKRTPTKAVRAPKHSTAHALRLRAEREYIQDADSNSAEWHWEHGGYGKVVSVHTFVAWAKADNWAQNRKEYWRRIQERLLAHISDKILARRKDELEELGEVREAVLEMLQPMRDNKTGKIKRNETTGLPMFHVDLPPYDRLVKVYLDLDDRIEERTRDLVHRATSIEGGPSSAEAGSPLLPSGSNLKLSRTEAQELARQLVMKRNAERLKTGDEGAIDVESEDGDDKL